MNKPSGMLVHRGWARAPVVLVDLVAELLGVETVHPVHRLDRGTSGVIVFGLDPAVTRDLQASLQDGGADKRYLALVRGRPPGRGDIDHPIPRQPKGPRVPARTTYERLATAVLVPRHLSLVLARPRTGRLHQVRRHLKHIDHPVIGDSNHGKGALNREATRRWGLRRLALHAWTLDIDHPVTKEHLHITAPLPEDLAAPLQRMGLDERLWSEP